MKSVSILKYKNKESNGLNRLPYIQSGSSKMLKELVPLMSNNPELEEILNKCINLGTVSVNLVDREVANDEEVYVELYENISELVKLTMIQVLQLVKAYPMEYVDKYFVDKTINSLNRLAKYDDIKLAELRYSILNHLETLKEISEYETSNIFELLNAFEKPEIKGSIVFLYELLEELQEMFCSFVCSRDEFLELMNGENKDYFSIFIKSVQFSINVPSVDKCVGVSEFTNTALPIFNIGGIVTAIDNIQEYINIEDVENIIKELEKCNIETYLDLQKEIYRNCLNLEIENIEYVINLVQHELLEVLINKHEYFSGDMYNILIRQTVKKY